MVDVVAQWRWERCPFNLGSGVQSTRDNGPIGHWSLPMGSDEQMSFVVPLDLCLRRKPRLVGVKYSGHRVSVRPICFCGHDSEVANRNILCEAERQSALPQFRDF